MQIHKSYIVVGLVIALALFLGIVAHAQEANEHIHLTFEKSAHTSGQVSVPGTYTFQLGDPVADQSVVGEY